MATLDQLFKWRPPKTVANTGDFEHLDKLHKAKQRREEWRGDRRKLRQIETTDKEDRNARLANAYKHARHQKSIQSNPGIAKLVRVLTREYSGTVAYTRRDVDLDVAGLIRRCGISASDSIHDRFVVLEICCDWCNALAKEQRTYRLDDEGDLFSERTPETLDEVKSVLSIS